MRSRMWNAFRRHTFSPVLPAATFFAGAIAIALLPHPVLALTIRVPADQSTIQAALDVAASTDTVLVAAGTYQGPGNQDLDFSGKALVLRSEAGAEVTILDLDSTFQDPHHGFVFDDAEPSSARVEGFTVTGSYGGGGVFTNGSSPTIAGCTFTQNDGGNGGGVYIDNGNPVFEDCIFSQNTPALGGGAYIRNSQSTFVRCVFAGNGADSGGGVWVAPAAQLLFTDCVFEGNTVGALGDVWGGGMSVEGGTVTLVRCRFSENTAFSADDGAGRGGALYVDGATLSAQNCTFDRNQATHGGAIYANAFASFNGCVLRENVARQGGATYVTSNAGIQVAGCTFFDNEGTAGASGIYAQLGGGAAVDHTIIAFGRGGEAVECASSKNNATCCDFFGNEGGDWTGCLAGHLGTNGNIAANPLFCHTDFGDLTLAESSPCAAAQSACGQMGAFGTECQTSVEPATWGRIKAAYGGRGR